MSIYKFCAYNVLCAFQKFATCRGLILESDVGDRFAKRKLDESVFLGNQIQVTYAPEYESLSDTKEKLEGRRKEVLARLNRKSKVTCSLLLQSSSYPSHCLWNLPIFFQQEDLKALRILVENLPQLPLLRSRSQVPLLLPYPKGTPTLRPLSNFVQKFHVSWCLDMPCSFF